MDLLREAAAAIIAWDRENRRSLPWRDDPAPYHVWISEIMLQQTRIETVIPYYRRFMERFPSVEALAGAEEEEILKLWEGLGYYSRARRLKPAAQMIMRDCGGQLPADAALLRRIPGIGDYTAGAIASLAYGLPEPAVDGNVLRVLARLFGSEEDVLQPAVRKKTESLLRSVYPSGPDAALLTEGVMELGETVCLPGTAPACGSCPLVSFCTAHQQGREAELPVRSTAKERRKETLTVLILVCGDKRAVRKRPDSGLLAGLWELPHLPGLLNEEETGARLAELGLAPLRVEACGSARHLFTHVEWQMMGYRIEVDPKSPALIKKIPGAPAGDLLWETPDAIRSRYTIPSSFRAFLKQL